MLCAECLHRDTQFHGSISVRAYKLVMLQLDHIALGIGDRGCDTHQLTRLIRKQDRYREDAVSLDQAVLYDRGHGDHIHVASA